MQPDTEETHQQHAGQPGDAAQQPQHNNNVQPATLEDALEAETHLLDYGEDDPIQMDAVSQLDEDQLLGPVSNIQAVEAEPDDNQSSPTSPPVTIEPAKDDGQALHSWRIPKKGRTDGKSDGEQQRPQQQQQYGQEEAEPAYQVKSLVVVPDRIAVPERSVVKKGSPTHPCYTCTREPMTTFGGGSYRPSCALVELKLGAVLPGVPEALKKMPVNNIVMLAHYCSIMIDSRIPANLKQQKMLNIKEPYVSVDGMAVAWAAGRNNCTHLASEEEPVWNIIKFESQPFRMTMAEFEEAWERSKTLDWSDQGVKYVKEERLGILILVPPELRNMADLMVAEGGRIVCYDKLDEIKSKMCYEKHSVCYVILPTYSPLFETQWDVLGIEATAEKTGTKVILVPPPAGRGGKHEELVVRIAEAMKTVSEQCLRRKVRPRVESLFSQPGATDRISDFWRSLGTEPRERSSHLLSGHQLDVYLRALSTRVGAYWGFPKISRRSQEKKVEKSKPFNDNQRQREADRDQRDGDKSRDKMVETATVKRRTGYRNDNERYTKRSRDSSI